LLNFLDRKSASRQPGFTRACRAILMESDKPLAPRMVCQKLQHKFPEVLERHKDPIASVTTVLSRLADYAEARCSLDANGRRVWQWIAEPQNRPNLVVPKGSKLSSEQVCNPSPTHPQDFCLASLYAETLRVSRFNTRTDW